MIKINEKSLCGTCEHLQFCVITTNKSFIHSCSEYQTFLKSDINTETVNKKELVLN